MKNLIFTILILTGLAAFAGLNPVLQNTYTTNTQSAADVYVASLIGGPTNGVTATTVTNIINNNRPASQWTTNNPGVNLNGGTLTNLNAANLTGIVSSSVLPSSVLTNNASNVTLAGTFTGIHSGDGSGLTNLNVTAYVTNGPGLAVGGGSLGVPTSAYTIQWFGTTNNPEVTSLVVFSNLTDVFGITPASVSTILPVKSPSFIGTFTGDAGGATNYNYTNLVGAPTTSNLATTNFVNSSISTLAGVYQPSNSATANSYTATFTIPTYQTNWTVVLTVNATNYLVIAELYLSAKVANPSGISLPLNGAIDADNVTGSLYPAHPFSVLSQGDGKTYIVSMDGDKANFLDNTGQPYSFSQANVAAGFNLQAVFTWTIHK